MRCGKPTCRCQREDDPGSGPYFVLDCQTGGFKTTRSIPAERVSAPRVQVEECKRLRRLTSELVEVSERLYHARLAAESTDADKKTLGTAYAGAIQAEIEVPLSRCPDGALDLAADLRNQSAGHSYESRSYHRHGRRRWGTT